MKCSIYGTVLLFGLLVFPRNPALELIPPQYLMPLKLPLLILMLLTEMRYIFAVKMLKFYDSQIGVLMILVNQNMFTIMRIISREES